jgi:hypothetical protein
MAIRGACMFLIAGLALLAGAGPARAQDSVRVAYQFWPEIDVFVRLSSQARLYFIATPVQEVEDGILGRITDLQIGGFIEVGLMPFNRRRAARARHDGDNRMRYLRLRSGIEHVSPPGDPEGEWRWVTELRPRLPLPAEMLVELRDRLELRSIDGGFSWRNRLRLWLEREFHVGRGALVPYGSAESFWDSRFDAFTRVRYQLGTVVPINARVAPEVNYTQDRDDVEGMVSITHALNVIVTLFF